MWNGKSMKRCIFIQVQDFNRILPYKWTMSFVYGILSKEFVVRKDNCWDELE